MMSYEGKEADERAWYHERRGKGLVVSYLALAAFTVYLSVAGLQVLPFLPDTVVGTTIPFYVYFYAFLGAMAYTFASFVTDPDKYEQEPLPILADGILTRVKNWPIDATPVSQSEKILTDIRAWSADEVTTEAEQILHQLSTWSPKQTDSRKQAETILTRISMWQSESELTEADKILGRLLNWTPDELDSPSDADQTLALIRSWSPLDGTTLSRAEQTVALVRSQSRLGGGPEGESTNVLSQLHAWSPDDAEAGDKAREILSKLNRASTDPLTDLAVYGVIEPREIESLREQDIATLDELLRTKGDELEMVLQEERRVRTVLRAAGNLRWSTDEEMDPYHVQKSTTDLWKLGLRIVVALLLAAGTYLLLFRPGLLPEAREPAGGLAFLVGLFVKPAYRTLGGIADRLLSTLGSEREPIARMSRVIVEKPWYDTQIGVVLMFVYLLLTVVALGVSTRGVPYPSLIPAIPGSMRIPPILYLYSFIGALTYAFISLLNDFGKGFVSLLQVGLRIPVALLLAAGVFLLGDALVTSTATVTIAQLTFVVGLYVKLTLSALATLAAKITPE